MRLTRRRIFYVAVTVAALTLFSFVAHRSWIAWQNHRVNEWVESYGGRVDWAPVDGNSLRTPQLFEDLAGEPIFDDITMISMSGSPAISLDEVESLTRLRQLWILDMGVSSFGDDHLKVLSKSKSITGLFLTYTEVTDEGLAEMAESMPQLELLCLKLSKITGEGLSHLKKMPNLKQLWIEDNPFTDADLASLRGMDNLIELEVGQQITDAGISEIILLKSLERISFTLSSVTDSGIDALISELPNLKELALSGTNITDEKLTEIQRSGIHLEERGL